MEVLGLLAGGFGTALQPINVGFLMVGVLLGLVIGVLPGLGGTSGVAILLPISVVIARGDIAGATSTTAVILLAGTSSCGLSGGVWRSLLLNIPALAWASTRSPARSGLTSARSSCSRASDSCR